MLADSKKGGGTDPSNLIPYILLEIFLARYVQANTTLAERLGFDLVGCAGHGRNHYIGDCQAFFKGELGRVRDVMSVEPVLVGDARTGPFGIFLQCDLRFHPLRGNKHKSHTWIESISTENTRAPSFANNAARGRPTTSDLRYVHYS